MAELDLDAIERDMARAADSADADVAILLPHLRATVAEVKRLRDEKMRQFHMIGELRSQLAEVERERDEWQEEAGRRARRYDAAEARLVEVKHANRALKSALEGYTAQAVAAAARLAAVRDASVRHPHTCGMHPDDSPVLCGWKSAVMDMRTALDGGVIANDLDVPAGLSGLPTGRESMTMQIAFQRLSKIAEMHVKYVGEGGMTNGCCAECGLGWPCPTFDWARGDSDRDPRLSCWDRDDDPTDEEVEQAYQRLSDMGTAQPEAHGMIPGSHERAGGPECRCGVAWNRWADRCAAQPDHEFLPVNGHPDDDECTFRADGTDATYCGMTRDEHDPPQPDEEWP